MNNRSWEDTDGGKLLKKWHKLSVEINAASVEFSSRHFSMKRGLITHLDPDLIRLQNNGGLTVEMDLSKGVYFDDVVSAEIVRDIPVLTRSYPEQLKMSDGRETWMLFGPTELEGKR
jgi:hypothetical protein